tara:strand:+ start:2450 stop:2623 length:174 start_codon:yes stop_codon:yes gene_type:complete
MKSIKDTCKNNECNETELKSMSTERFVGRDSDNEPIVVEEWMLWCPECEEITECEEQ